MKREHDNSRHSLLKDGFDDGHDDRPLSGGGSFEERKESMENQDIHKLGTNTKTHTSVRQRLPHTEMRENIEPWS